MVNTNVSDFKEKIDDFMEQTIKYNQPVNINTKSGNAILISEEEYNNINATFELISNPHMKDKIIDGLNTPISECINESKVEW